MSLWRFNMSDSPFNIKQLGLQHYEPVWREMQHYTQTRTAESADEIWFLEHHPVFTQGQAGKKEHLLNPGDIPVIQVDRGGQVTYHGPGQLVVYFLIDIRRRQLGVRNFVCSIEKAVIDYLKEFNIQAQSRADAPGIYINNAKIGSIGLRIKRGASFHGLSFNVNMDLSPFSRINPCGYANLKMTQLCDLGGPEDTATVIPNLLKHLQRRLFNY